MKIKKNRKILVVDTSIFTYDAFALKSFKDSNIIIPIAVVEELDKVKKLTNESGKNARVAIRYLDEISKTGEIHSGIEIDNNCSVQVDVSSIGSVGSDPTYGDNKILFCAVSAQKLGQATVITRDINLRIKARALGLNAEEYNHDRIDKSELYTGVQKIVNEEMGAALISCEELSGDELPLIDDLYPNECVIFLAEDGKPIVTGRKVKNYLKIVKDRDPWGLIAKNSEQKLAIDMLLDPKLPLVSITGMAGSGKSLCALACGLELVLNAKKFSTFPIYKPIQSVGSDIGFLPGEIQDKLSPHFVSVDDGFQFLLSDNLYGKQKSKESWKEKLYQYTTNGTITKEAISYIRGRNIINSFILIDEAQNLSKEEIKTIVTRTGIGSKIILLGDINQIDSPGLDATSNGLSYLIEKFKKSNLSGHITFSKGERSSLATEAAELL